jgi:hypothetical protein
MFQTALGKAPKRYFLCEFKYYNVPNYICRKYDFNNPPEKTTWGENVVDHHSESTKPGAISDYQTFVKKEIIEKDFEGFKSSILSREVVFWPEKHSSSNPL